MFKRGVTISRFSFMRLACRFSSQDNSVILTEFESCGIITLNRPKVLNSLNLSMIRRIYPQLKEWNRNPSISHVIIEGAGEKAFCAGGDVRAVVEAAKKRDSLVQDFFREEYQLNHLIGTLNKPFIALLNGVTMGGGAGLSVHGRYRIATERTMFAMPETAIGFFPDVGGGFFLPRLVHPGLGVFLALSGHRLRGIDVLWSGVATHYVESKNIQSLKECLVNLKFTGDNNSFSQKVMVIQAIDDLLQKHCGLFANPPPPEELIPVLTIIGKIFALYELHEPVTVEQIISQLLNLYQNKGTSSQVAAWAERCYEQILTMSPTSLKVTLCQLQKGVKLSFTDNFKMEYMLSQKFTKDHDFYEGVRAVLIDKDNKPKWSPNRLSLIRSNKIDSYFAPLTDQSEWNP